MLNTKISQQIKVIMDTIFSVPFQALDINSEEGKAYVSIQRLVNSKAISLRELLANLGFKIGIEGCKNIENTQPFIIDYINKTISQETFNKWLLTKFWDGLYSEEELNNNMNEEIMITNNQKQNSQKVSLQEINQNIITTFSKFINENAKIIEANNSPYLSVILKGKEYGGYDKAITDCRSIQELQQIKVSKPESIMCFIRKYDINDFQEKLFIYDDKNELVNFDAILKVWVEMNQTLNPLNNDYKQIKNEFINKVFQMTNQKISIAEIENALIGIYLWHKNSNGNVTQTSNRLYEFIQNKYAQYKFVDIKVPIGANDVEFQSLESINHLISKMFKQMVEDDKIVVFTGNSQNGKDFVLEKLQKYMNSFEQSVILENVIIQDTHNLTPKNIKMPKLECKIMLSKEAEPLAIYVQITNSLIQKTLDRNTLNNLEEFLAIAIEKDCDFYRDIVLKDLNQFQVVNEILPIEVSEKVFSTLHKKFVQATTTHNKVSSPKF